MTMEQRRMRVALVGGVYGREAAYRQRFRITPETTLEKGLRLSGVEVTTFSHHEPVVGEFDVMHVHHLSWGAVDAALARSRAALIFTPHSAAEMTRTMDAGRRLAMWLTAHRADRVVALSAAEARFWRDSYGVAEDALEVIPNGIDADEYPMRRSNSVGRSGYWEVLYVGQLETMKRVDLLLRAVASVRHPVKLRLAYQNDRLEAELRSLACALGIESRVEFLGLQGPERLRELYNAADLFVLPSASEALPSVVTEAMLTGTPLIATDTGGVAWQLGGFGRLIPRNDPDALTRAMDEVFTGYEQEAGRCVEMMQYARRTFSTEAMIARHESLYRSLSEDGAQRRSTYVPGPVLQLARRLLWQIHARKGQRKLSHLKTT